MEIWDRFSRLPLSDDEKGQIYSQISDLGQEKLQVLIPSFLSDQAVAASLRKKFIGKKRATRIESELWGLPLTHEEQARLCTELAVLPEDEVSTYFSAPTAEVKALTLRSLLKKIEGKKRAPDIITFATKRIESTKTREYAFSLYHPACVEARSIVGPPDPILVALRWLFLLVDVGKEVNLSALRTKRMKKEKVTEPIYYPGVLAFLRSASLGQEGVIFGGQGFGNVKTVDLQGFIVGVQRAPMEVKCAVKFAKDNDPQGILANAALIRQEADCLSAGILDTPDTARLGCLFCRMDRFWLVKYLRDTGIVQVAPRFPPVQHPNETPQQMEVADEAFILMNLRWLHDERFSTIYPVTLADVLPAQPTGGFSTLVAFVQQLQIMFHLKPSAARFVTNRGEEIAVSDLTCLAYSHKSLVLLRRSTATVLKVVKNSDIEKSIHAAVDGHPNVRRLVQWGTVDIGTVFTFLELEGFGEPFSGKHISDLSATEKMWKQAMRALHHLHSNNVVHRDVKPDNMLVFPEDVLKLNDYDVSCFMDDERITTEVVGTRGYQSPSTSHIYTPDDDILSLGLTFYSTRLGITDMSRKGHISILRHLLHPDLFPEVMRRDVKNALTMLRLDSDDAELATGDDTRVMKLATMKVMKQ